MTQTVDGTRCAKPECGRPFRDGEWVFHDEFTGENIHHPAYGGCRQVGRPASLSPDHTHAVGKALADEGAAAAFNTLDERLSTWRSDATKAMDLFIRRGRQFTSDDIADQVGDPPKPNAMGGLFMAHKHRLNAVGYTTTKRQSGHNRVIRVWCAKSSTVEQ